MAVAGSRRAQGGHRNGISAGGDSGERPETCRPIARRSTPLGRQVDSRAGMGMAPTLPRRGSPLAGFAPPVRPVPHGTGLRLVSPAASDTWRAPNRRGCRGSGGSTRSPRAGSRAGRSASTVVRDQGLRGLASPEYRTHRRAGFGSRGREASRPLQTAPLRATGTAGAASPRHRTTKPSWPSRPPRNMKGARRHEAACPGSAGILPAWTTAGLRPVAGKMPALPGRRPERAFTAKTSPCESGNSS